MGVPVLSSGVWGMRFGCGMKMIKDRNSSSKFSLDVGGRDFLHVGPTAESASHHFRKNFHENRIFQKNNYVVSPACKSALFDTLNTNTTSALRFGMHS